MLGYLNGISCAVLVAKIQQDFPDYDVVDLVYKFFEVYSKSDWRNPVAIKFFGKKDKISLSSWKKALDNVERDYMAILSPNYELRNTTHRVKEPTFDVIIKELQRGFTIMQEIVPVSQKCYAAVPVNQMRKDDSSLQILKLPQGKVDASVTWSDDKQASAGDSARNAVAEAGEKEPQVDKSAVSWTKFFKRLRFFDKRYNNFIRIDAVANSVEGCEDSCLKWAGFVESQLFIFLNMVANQHEIEEIRAYPRSFKSKVKEDFLDLGLVDPEVGKFEFVETYFLGFKLHRHFKNCVINLEEQAI
mmetsp:Transcript_4015/g.6792  ORF Transcript_4015/g.6792 Transcript_4015/m.6792 type:complete len:302 (-) Transcript_4015:163-1068(-)